MISFTSEGKTETFPVMRFFLELTQHIPPKGCQYIRRYGLYASRTKGKWPYKPHATRLAPAGWKKQQQQADQDGQPRMQKQPAVFLTRKAARPGRD